MSKNKSKATKWGCFYTTALGIVIGKGFTEELTPRVIQYRLGRKLAADLEPKRSFSLIASEIGITEEEAEEITYQALGKVAGKLWHSQFGKEMRRCAA